MAFSTVIVASIISLTPLIFFYCKIQEAGSGGAQAQAADGSVSRAKARSLNPEGCNDNLSSTQIESAIQSSHSQIDTIIIKFSNLTQTRTSVQSPMPGFQQRIYVWAVSLFLGPRKNWAPRWSSSLTYCLGPAFPTLRRRRFLLSPLERERAV